MRVPHFLRVVPKFCKAKLMWSQVIDLILMTFICSPWIRLRGTISDDFQLCVSQVQPRKVKSFYIFKLVEFHRVTWLGRLWGDWRPRRGPWSLPDLIIAENCCFPEDEGTKRKAMIVGPKRWCAIGRSWTYKWPILAKLGRRHSHHWRHLPPQREKGWTTTAFLSLTCVSYWPSLVGSSWAWSSGKGNLSGLSGLSHSQIQIIFSYTSPR